MASKNIFSEGYTQLPVLASLPVSVSWLTGQAVSGGDDEPSVVIERGMEEITRSVPRRGLCCCGCVVWEGGGGGSVVEEEEEEEEK